MEDFLGRPISLGDYLVFPSRHSSNMWMNLAWVVDFKQMKTWRGEETKPVVRSLNGYGRKQLNSKTGILHCPERAVIMQRRDIPFIYLEIFEGPVKRG